MSASQGAPPRPWRPLDLSTILLAVSIGTAPITGLLPVAILSAIWLLTVAFQTVALVRRTFPWSVEQWVFAIVVGATTVRMSALGLVQLIGDRPALMWNVDWRYHATQAHGIARFAGVGDSLEYAGEPVEYHAGPSWIAASLHDAIGAPINLVLFLLVPAASVVVVAITTTRLLRLIGAPGPASLVATAVALSIPASPLTFGHSLLRGRFGVLIDAETWWFTPSLMLNSLLALAVGLTAATVLVEARSARWAALGALGAAAVLPLKPQYALGLGMALGLGYVVGTWRGQETGRGRVLLVVVLTAAVAGSAFHVLNPEAVTYSTFEVGVPLVKSIVISLVFAAAAVAVGVACIGATRRRQPASLPVYGLGGALGAMVLVVILGSTTFLLDEAALANARAVGLDYDTAWQDFNVGQALLPATFVLVAIAVAMLAQSGDHGPRIVAFGAAGLLVVVTPITVSPIIDPTGDAAYEWTEEAELAELVDLVDPEAGRWASSDLADSAEDFARPLRGGGLTSLAPAQFHLSNVVYSGWTQDDVVQRVESLRRFFFTEWSSRHEEFLDDTGIRFVLIRDRCPAAWELADFPGRLVAVDGPWSLLDAAGDPEARPGPSPWPEWSGEARFGLGACMSGEVRATSAS